MHDQKTIELPGGYSATITADYDQTMGAPWDENDGHGEVRQGYKADKRPGDWILGEAGGRDWHYLYNAQAAQAIALRDGWNAPPYDQGTKREQAARAVRADFQYLRGWAIGDWCYLRLHVELQRDGKTVADAYLGGVESLDDCWIEAGREMAAELHAAETAETQEAQFWAQRDTVTIAARP